MIDARTRELIRSRIVDLVAIALDVSPMRVAGNVPVNSLRLDAACIETLTRDLSGWLDFEVDPLLWLEYSTIDDMANHLAGEIRIVGSPPAYTS
ncbi:hypothetical protein FHW69_002880 [Luteibacter sp. Sphag1AF]|uniref:hypothetical protein n=1 Tax=Luteibacter sp. Sphag1AF TaxID=2587031 RepID=UPI001609A359|nr:hypothetical protein [Luteibacter sp. Sphag1AF]MBB3228245.1 hypothetical protein [Luteibacter sp. Sphag1AF]